MTRLGIVFWLVLVAAAGFTTFKVKYAVQDIEDQLNRVRKQTIADQQEIRVLTAEWTYLNQPERLAEMNRRFLALAPVTARQLQSSIADIPFRAPPTAPDVMLAAAPVAAAPQALDSASPATEAGAPLITPLDAPQVVPAALGAAPAIAELRSAEAPETEQRGATDRLVDAVPVQTTRTVPVQLAKAAPVQLATAGPLDAPNSLDALIAQIADAR
jgi:cell division protein FtsL